MSNLPRVLDIDSRRLFLPRHPLPSGFLDCCYSLMGTAEFRLYSFPPSAATR